MKAVQLAFLAAIALAPSQILAQDSVEAHISADGSVSAQNDPFQAQNRFLQSKATKVPSIKSTKVPSIKSTKAPSIKSTKAPTVVTDDDAVLDDILVDDTVDDDTVDDDTVVDDDSTNAPSIKSTKAPSIKSSRRGLLVFETKGDE